MMSKNLSVCLSVTNFDLNYFRTDEIEWAEIFWGMSLSKSHISPLLNLYIVEDPETGKPLLQDDD